MATYYEPTCPGCEESEGKIQELEEEIEKLKKVISKPSELETKCNELLMEVVNKVPRETRHEAALRLIRSGEKGGDYTAKQDIRETEG